jgi:hypothetical protein
MNETILYRGTSTRKYLELNKEGIKTSCDFTYPDSENFGIPLIYLTDYEDSAKTYAYFKCIGKKISLKLKQYFIQHNNKHLSENGSFIDYNSIGGKPLLLKVKINTEKTNLLIHSATISNTEYYVLKNIPKEDIISIEPIKEHLWEICKKINNNILTKIESEIIIKQKIEYIKSLGLNLPNIKCDNLFEILEKEKWF